MSEFSLAPDVEELAKPLIDQFHPHLMDAKIVYVFNDEIPTKAGKQVWGTMRKVTNLPAFLANNDNSPFFVMTISKPIWDTLTLEKRKALIDHELCHAKCKFDEDSQEYKLSINSHDLEEFKEIVQRYGLWRDDVKDFVNSVKE